MYEQSCNIGGNTKKFVLIFYLADEFVGSFDEVFLYAAKLRQGIGIGYIRHGD